jgi:aspartate racemase
MTRHIGIVAVSAEGAALCYRTVCVEGSALLGRHAHPEITLHTFPLADYMRHIDADDWGAVGELLLSSVAKLQKTGVDLLICPDNTVHQAIDLVRDRSPLPWLHIAEEVAAVAAQRQFKRVLVLGTRYLMESSVYPAKLAPMGIEVERPPPEDRERINALTFDELVYGQFKESTRSYFTKVIADGQRRGCDAVALSCTEFPLLVGDADSPLPTLDSTRILARAALREAVHMLQTTGGQAH